MMYLFLNSLLNKFRKKLSSSIILILEIDFGRNFLDHLKKFSTLFLELFQSKNYNERSKLFLNCAVLPWKLPSWSHFVELMNTWTLSDEGAIFKIICDFLKSLLLWNEIDSFQEIFWFFDFYNQDIPLESHISSFLG